MAIVVTEGFALSEALGYFKPLPKFTLTIEEIKV